MITDYHTSSCSNCGKSGHLFQHCKYPITSVGIIAFRKNIITGNLEYLLIRRRDTIGFIEFIRGKYPNNKNYILNLINEMTLDEKNKLLTMTFSELWNELWGQVVGIQYRGEEKMAREKFENLRASEAVASANKVEAVANKVEAVASKAETNKVEAEASANKVASEAEAVANKVVAEPGKSILKGLIEQSNTRWVEQEWGFPKGRHNYQEKDLVCALREFEEETGYAKKDIDIIQNLIPLEEIFTGSNYKSYKHKYFLASMNKSNSERPPFDSNSEVSLVEWKDYESALSAIRPYNLEKIDVLKNANAILCNYLIK
jgi:8-oxo-dGTP pyrophosphatase MutT (NUDIX family)